MLDMKQFYAQENEEPLDRIADDGGLSGIFRTVACVGDSLSSGEFEYRNEDGGGGIDMFEHSVIQYLARAAGFKAYNFTVGGMAAADFIKWFAEQNGCWDKDKLAQAYVIALGVNDIFNEHQPFGSIDDIDFDDYRNNKPTYTGYYAQIIQRYKSLQPEARFFLVTVPMHGSPELQEQINGICKVIYDLAEHFDHCYVVDLAKYMPVIDREFNRNFSLYGHRNPAGYLFYSKILGSYIDYIIRHNPEEFDDVGFIGTGLHK